jgi:hypothetical protein
MYDWTYFHGHQMLDTQKNTWATYSCCKVVSLAMLGDKVPVNPDELKVLQTHNDKLSK